MPAAGADPAGGLALADPAGAFAVLPPQPAAIMTTAVAAAAPVARLKLAKTASTTRQR
jgi:hypothetical protein